MRKGAANPLPTARALESYQQLPGAHPVSIHVMTTMPAKMIKTSRKRPYNLLIVVPQLSRTQAVAVPYPQARKLKPSNFALHRSWMLNERAFSQFASVTRSSVSLASAPCAATSRATL